MGLVKYLSMQKASIFVILALFFCGFSSHAALTLKQKVKMCDSFYAQDKPPAQESGQYSDMQDFLVSRFVECANTYEKAGQQDKIEYAQVQHQRLYDAYTNFVSSFDTAECESNDLSDFGFKDFKDLQGEMSEFGLQEVADINGFKKAYAADAGIFEAVGQLVGKSDQDINCNTTYIEMPSGERGFVTSAHCLFAGGNLKYGNSIDDFKINIGLNSKNPDESFTVMNARCGNLNSHKIDDKNYDYKDECFLKVKERVDLKPFKRKYLTGEQQMRYINEGKKVALVGFHPERRGGSLYSTDGKRKYPVRTTRTKQACLLKQPPSLSSDHSRFLIYDCDTVNGSSGAPIFRLIDGELSVIGVHKNYTGDRANYAVSVLPHELIHEVPSQVASR
jgi:V8-like Glu-specific endopeptidase